MGGGVVVKTGFYRQRPQGPPAGPKRDGQLRFFGLCSILLGLALLWLLG